jgi:hypothetical protein
LRYPLSALLLVSSLAVPAFAAEQPAQTDSVIRIDHTALQAAIDPTTGQIRQLTPVEARELAASFMKSVVRKPLKPVTASNGMTTIELDDTYQNYFTARIDVDGVISFNCVNGPDQVVSILTGDTESIMTRKPVARPTAAPTVWEKE